MGITVDDLSKRYPTLFHMAAEGSWPSIQERGLLSTSALLDLYDIEGEERIAIESQHRPDWTTITHDRFGPALIRDQKPMDDNGLLRSLQGGLQPEDWYRILNSKAFFWVAERRLCTIMNARAYRDHPKTLIYVDTRELLEQYSDRVLLSPMNTGATKPMAFPRGPETFQPLDQFPYEERLKINRQDPIVELAVEGGVQNIADFVIRVEAVYPDMPTEVLFAR